MSTAADKPVRHILALSGGKAASCFPAFDMLGSILTRYYPKPIVGGSLGAFKDGDTSSKSQRKASELTVNCAELKGAAKSASINRSAWRVSSTFSITSSWPRRKTAVPDCEFKVKKERLKYDWKKLPVVRKVECRDDIYGYKFAELWVV